MLTLENGFKMTKEQLEESIKNKNCSSCNNYHGKIYKDPCDFCYEFRSTLCRTGYKQSEIK